MDGFEFSHEMEVRDYECDSQGIVNHGVYLNYLEHVRLLYLKGFGIDFADYTRRGIHLVVVRAELDYRSPLTSGDRFRVGVNYLRGSRLKFVFEQEIVRLPDEKPVLSARITSAALNERGRPFMPPEFAARLGDESATKVNATKVDATKVDATKVNATKLHERERPGGHQWRR